MPAKNSTLKNGDRFNPLNRKLYTQFKKDSGIDIDFKTFQSIIWGTNKIIGESAVDSEAGVQLPHIGNIVVTKYKSRKIPIDFKNTNRLEKTVPLLNMHSFGYIYHIKWYKTIARFQNRNIYKFEACREIKRRLSKNIKAGNNYFKWTNSDFWSITKLDRSYNKFYKNEK